MPTNSRQRAKLGFSTFLCLHVMVVQDCTSKALHRDIFPMFQKSLKILLRIKVMSALNIFFRASWKSSLYVKIKRWLTKLCINMQDKRKLSWIYASTIISSSTRIFANKAKLNPIPYLWKNLIISKLRKLIVDRLNYDLIIFFFNHIYMYTARKI